MANGHSDEFRRDAVRIALTSGLTRRQVSSDLGVGLSTLNKWVKAYDEDAIVSGPDQELARQNERLRRENRILKEERDVLKKATAFFARQKTRGSHSLTSITVASARRPCANFWASRTAATVHGAPGRSASASGTTW